MSFAEHAANDTGKTLYTRVDGNTLPTPEMSYGSGASYQPHEGNDDAYDRAFSELTDAIRAYQEHITGISRLSRKLGSREDSRNLRDNIHVHMDKGRVCMTSITIQLKSFSSFVSKATGQQKIKRRAAQRKLVRDFKTQVKQYEKYSKSASALEEQSEVRGSSQDYCTPNSEASMFASGDPVLYEETEENQRLLGQEAILNDEIIAERQQAMRSVHQSVQQVNEIFSDLADLVEEQHEEIVTIDSEARDAYDKTKNGVGELGKASEYQQSTNNKMKWILGIIFVCGAIFLVYQLLNKN